MEESGDEENGVGRETSRMMARIEDEKEKEGKYRSDEEWSEEKRKGRESYSMK
jgi:hypothetical protein